MSAMCKTMLGLGLVAFIAAPAAAQGRRGGGFFRGNPAMLLHNESVQKELKLDESQVEKAGELFETAREKMRENFQATQDLEGQERMAKMRELNQEFASKLNKDMGEFLKPAQMKRLHQIALQQQGLMAFMHPRVAARLKLSDEQKTEIREVMQETREKMPTREDFQDDREAAMKKREEVSKEAVAQIETKLNDEQRKTWKELLGAPFEVKFQPR